MRNTSRHTLVVACAIVSVFVGCNAMKGRNDGTGAIAGAAVGGVGAGLGAGLATGNPAIGLAAGIGGAARRLGR